MATRLTDDDIRRFRTEAAQLQIGPVVGLCARALGEDEPGPGGLTPEQARERLAWLIEAGNCAPDWSP